MMSDGNIWSGSSDTFSTWPSPLASNTLGGKPASSYDFVNKRAFKSSFEWGHKSDGFISYLMEL